MRLTNGFRDFLNIYLLFYYMLSPLIVGMAGSIPALIMDNGYYAWLMVLSMPIGVLMMSRYWPGGEKYDAMIKRWFS